MAIAPYIPGRSTTDDGRKVAKIVVEREPARHQPGGARGVRGGAGARLERYPDASGTELRDALAAKHGLDPTRIIYGNGSDELLHLAAGAYRGRRRRGDLRPLRLRGVRDCGAAGGRGAGGGARSRLCDRCRCDPGVRHRADAGGVYRQPQQSDRHLCEPRGDRAAARRAASRHPAGDRPRLCRIYR